jgi:hypothetical protein
MERSKITLPVLLLWMSVIGNILFVLWILYNAIDSRFQGTLPEKVSGIGLISLLIVNTFLILNNKRKAD